MKVEYNNNTYTVPDFLIVGAAKSGTTSLFNYLKSSSELFLPKEKEPHFFTFFNAPPSFKSPENLPTVVSSIKNYSNSFRKASDNLLIGEASQSYLYKYDTVIKNIKTIYGDKVKDLKIIIILRNPIERAWSQYWHFRKNDNENLSFDEAINRKIIEERMQNQWNIFYDYIGFGQYADQIRSYKDAFENVKIFLHEDLKNNQDKTLDQICSFLNVSNFDIETRDMYNPSGLPRRNIYGKLWMMNSKSKTLKKFKKILPFELRRKFSNRLMEKALERQSLPEEFHKRLKVIYTEEINRIYQVVEREEVLSWL